MKQQEYQHFKQPIMKVIASRYSVRTYRPDKLSEEIKAELRKYADSIKGPFGYKVRLE